MNLPALPPMLMADFELPLRQAASACGAHLVAGCGFHLLQATLRWAKSHNLALNAPVLAAITELVRVVSEAEPALVPQLLEEQYARLAAFAVPEADRVSRLGLLALF